MLRALKAAGRYKERASPPRTRLVPLRLRCPGAGRLFSQWDARDQLTGMTGGGTASFQYDSQRRRIAKTIAGSTTAYAYDGDNFVQELATTGTSGAIKANLLTGDTDQLFSKRTGKYVLAAGVQR